MSAGTALRGMAWDHPRARDPLESIAAQWQRETGVRIDWDARPLKDFEDQPLEELATRYDLVLVDYPFTGVAAKSGLIVPVDDWADAEYLGDQRAYSVGPSYRSYTWDGRQWALALDAACQVSAVREDLWYGADLGRLPDTWNGVADFAAERSRAPSRVAIPLNPNHSYCAFLSVGITLAGSDFWRVGDDVQQGAAIESLEFLRSMAGDLHPASRDNDPIGISDLMAGSDEILFVPLMFGYSNYSRDGFRAHALTFGNAPGGASGRIGSVLGGVGLALSARSTQQDAAAALARHVVAHGTQSGVYAAAGGQPGHGAAWESDTVNAMTRNFFRATRATIDEAFLRPRVPGHRPFQPAAGQCIHDFIWNGGGSAKHCLESFNRLAREHLSDWGRDGNT